MRYIIRWREYFKFVTLKFGNKMFFAQGLRDDPAPQWQQNAKYQKAWIEGNTGVPFVDANMRELLHTGYLYTYIM
jgi:deoxyribodipyrimidine photo-lyase